MKMYVRPKEAMERVVGGAQSTDEMPSHPSLAFHELIKRLGNLVPQSPKDVTVMQRRLIRAGIRNESALKILYGAKVVCGVIFPLIALAVSGGLRYRFQQQDSRWSWLATAMGFFGPNEYVRRMAAGRQKQIARGSAERARPAGGLRRERTWVSIRPFSRSPRNWNTRIRRSARNSAW